VETNASQDAVEQENSLDMKEIFAYGDLAVVFKHQQGYWYNGESWHVRGFTGSCGFVFYNRSINDKCSVSISGHDWTVSDKVLW